MTNPYPPDSIKAASSSTSVARSKLTGARQHRKLVICDAGLPACLPRVNAGPVAESALTGHIEDAALLDGPALAMAARWLRTAPNRAR